MQRRNQLIDFMRGLRAQNARALARKPTERLALFGAEAWQ
ncbi:MAG: hypothetical protein RLZZ584_187 [Pseudomonadota bacterium]